MRRTGRDIMRRYLIIYVPPITVLIWFDFALGFVFGRGDRFGIDK